ncbi:MAG TPA: SDR family oxidoreductase [Candidatus Acidoferrales bacterium]|nr:SDR family oxidoreductase [Candidatus Acidoferrales bacterium]
MDRTYVVTGAASGIGAATARYLREHGGRVIGCDLRAADINADLTTVEGRKRLVDGANRLSGGAIDAIVANAGGGPPETMLALNFFGAVATLEGLRPLLEHSPAPRAVMVSSIASMGPAIPELVEACLSMDEPAATAAATAAIAAGKGPLDLYGSAKVALNRWCRRVAIGPDWAGAGITLNVVAPGFIDTPAAAYILSDPDRSAAAGRMVPMRGAFPGRPEQMAAMLAWCVSAENSLMTGQILFVDGGAECLARGERSW